MEDIDLFLQVSRKVLDRGRKSLQRLTKIESNLRELRVKYVTSTGETHETQEDDSDMDIAVEDLHLTEDHEHED